MRRTMSKEQIETVLGEVALPGWKEMTTPHMEARDAAVATAGGQQEVDARLQAALAATVAPTPEADKIAQEVAAARLIKIGHEIWPKVVFATSFFEPVALADDEWPLIEKQTPDQEWESTYIGEFNEGKQKQAIWAIEYELKEMKLLTSAEVFSPRMSLMKGRLDRFYQNMARVEKELALDIDDIAKALVVDATAASGLRAKLTFHPDVVQASIPDLNYFDFSADTDTYGTAGVITVQKMRALVDYCWRFSSDAEDDSTSLVPRVLFVNPARRVDITNFVTLVAAVDGSGEENPANTVPEGVREQIFRTGEFQDFWGMDIKVVTLNSLAVNEAYLSTNKPVGQIFTKPGMDETIIDRSVALWKKNQESFVIRKALLGITHSPWHKNAVRIKW